MDYLVKFEFSLTGFFCVDIFGAMFWLVCSFFTSIKLENNELLYFTCMGMMLGWRTFPRELLPL